jgi:DNA topoisomerase-1
MEGQTGRSAVELVWSDRDEPGYARRRRGKGFIYLAPDGSRLADEHIVSRLKGLAVPPAWRNVWYCLKENGHLQAAGEDDRGRVQYVYHPLWRALSDEAKFDRLAAFGCALPKARRAALAALEGADSRAAACALVFELLDRGALRIGNEAYAKENKAFGATTLRKRHVAVNGEKVALDFTAKGGARSRIEIADPRLAKIVRRFEGLPGQRLFQYRDEEGVKPLSSDAVNAFIREIMGEDFSAKDFRTFRGSAAAAETLMGAPAPATVKERREGVKAACAAAAEALGNTPAICKKSYVSPRLCELWGEGALSPYLAVASSSRLRLSRAERLVVAVAEDKVNGRKKRARRPRAHLRPGATVDRRFESVASV